MGEDSNSTVKKFTTTYIPNHPPAYNYCIRAYRNDITNTSDERSHALTVFRENEDTLGAPPSATPYPEERF